MTPEELRHAIADGESFTVEFKRGRRTSLRDQDIVAAVTCLANGDGGLLILGVEDDGLLSGLDPRHGDRTDPDRLRGLVLNSTEPPIACEVSIVSLDGTTLGLLDVPPSPTPVGTTGGLFVRRSTRADGSPECVPYRAHEIAARGLEVQGRDYAESPARGATPADLDPAEFDRFRRWCARGKGDRGLAELSDDEILRALRLSRTDSPEITLGAVALFGTRHALDRHLPTAEILLQETRGGAIATNTQLLLPLFAAAERIEDILDTRNTEEEIVVGLHRVSVPRLPPDVVREVVANAVVHRDYSELGPITVQLSEDDLRVASPGALPRGITLATLLDDSRPRSPILAEAFKRAGIVDRYGRGVRRIYTELLRLGREGPDYSATNDAAVIVRVPTSRADLELVRFIVEHEDASGETLSLDSLRILRELKDLGDATLGDLVSALGIPDHTVRVAVARLVEGGLAEPRGSGRRRRYHLTAVFYRTAQSPEYVRLHGTDPIQQEQMILTYVDRFGSITRSKAAELCRLSPPEARRVLKRLTELSELDLRGERRGSHYVRPGGS